MALDTSLSIIEGGILFICLVVYLFNSIKGDEEEEQPKSNLSVKNRYENALTKYRSKNYKTALLVFSNLYDEFPNHDLASNFVYWTGECYIGMNDYQSTIKTLEKVLEYENSSFGISVSSFLPLIDIYFNRLLPVSVLGECSKQYFLTCSNVLLSPKDSIVIDSNNHLVKK